MCVYIYIYIQNSLKNLKKKKKKNSLKQSGTTMMSGFNKLSYM